MRTDRRPTALVRPTALALAAMLAVAACGSSDDPAATGGGESGDATSDSPDPAEPGEAATGAGMQIVLDDGRSWTLDQYKCRYSPDNSGPFVELWSAGGTTPEGGELIAIMATPADPAATENSFSGSFIDDADGIAFVAIEGDAVSDGSTLTMTIGMHDSPNKRVGDPIDLIATVTCSL